MLIPTATEILKDKLPKYAPVDNQLEYMKYIEGKLSSNVKYINPYNALINNKDKYLYYRTDHHWTSKGAYLAYVEFCKSLGLEPKKEGDFQVELVANDFYGSLTSKIAVSGTINTNKVGKYTLTYTVTDSDGNKVSIPRVINVVARNVQINALIGTDRYDTAVRLSKGQFTTANTVMIANGGALADGLA
ncbi:MAG TPA: hypothetical protein DCW51_05005, partial [Clostridium sp.]|nr:hypothetical protein [Clostridium sp.]